MKFAVKLSVLFAIIALAGCKYSQKYETVNAGDKFSLSIPDWLKKEEGLKPGADFQYANRFRNFYAIGEVQPLTENDSVFAAVINTQTAIVKKSMDKPIVTDSINVDFGGAKGVRMEIMGKMSDESIFFSEVFLIGKKNNYHLSIWTRSEERKLKFKEDIQKILTSFKEL